MHVQVYISFINSFGCFVHVDVCCKVLFTTCLHVAGYTHNSQPVLWEVQSWQVHVHYVSLFMSYIPTDNFQWWNRSVIVVSWLWSMRWCCINHFIFSCYGVSHEMGDLYVHDLVEAFRSTIQILCTDFYILTAACNPFELSTDIPCCMSVLCSLHCTKGDDLDWPWTWEIV